eukprot:scaffold586_cov112-Skeletonema_dohrnii-CCMP3373.AAC.11
MVEFAEVWKDTAMMELAVSCFLCLGSRAILEDKYDSARVTATYVDTLSTALQLRLSCTRLKLLLRLTRNRGIGHCISFLGVTYASFSDASFVLFTPPYLVLV